MSIEAVTELSGAASNVWLVPFLPFLAFLIISLVTQRWGKLSAGLSIAALTGSLGIAASVFAQRFANDLAPMQASFPWIVLDQNHALGVIRVGFLVDNLSAAMMLMVCFVGLCIQVYSTSYISTEITHFATQDSASMSRFFGWLSLFTFSMLGLVLASNLLQVYIFWELVGVCSYLLIGFWYFKTSAAQAAKKAFVVTRFGDLGLLMGILLLGLTLQNFDFTALSTQFSQKAPEGMSLGIIALAGILIFCGAIGKSAQFPLQIWLPDAMEGPTPVSALIHAATMVAAGVYLVIRIFPIVFIAGVPTQAALLIAFVGTVTALIAASIAVVQNDIKRVLAYSTISQLGFMMAALGIGAYTAGSFHLLTHAFFKALLFLGSGAVIVACHTNDMWRMGGLRKVLPFTWFSFLMGCLALAGVPPFAGFWSKDEILSFAYSAPGGMVVFWLLTIAAFCTAFYVFRLYFITFEGSWRGESGSPADLEGAVPPATLNAPLEPSTALNFAPAWTEDMARASDDDLPSACLGAAMEYPYHGEHQPHEVSPLMWVPLLILAIFAIALGFVGIPAGMGLSIPNYFAHFIHSNQPATEHAFSYAPMLISTALAILGIVLAAVLYGRDAAAGERKLRKALGPVWVFLQQKWYMDHIWAWLLANTMYGAAKLAYLCDHALVDGAVMKTANFANLNGEYLRAEETGKTQQYLLVIIMGLLILALGVGYLEPQFLTSPEWWGSLITGSSPSVTAAPPAGMP